MKLLLIAAGLLITLLSSFIFTPQDEPQAVLSGKYDCRVGGVRISRGYSREEEFASFSVAAKTLRARDYSAGGLSSLQIILQQTCADDFDSEPKRAGAGGPQIELQHQVWRDRDTNSVSLIYLKKTETVIEFTVFDVKVSELSLVSHNANMDGRDRARAVSDYAAKKGKKTCRPISSVCVKCSDGTIVCGGEKIK